MNSFVVCTCGKTTVPNCCIHSSVSISVQPDSIIGITRKELDAKDAEISQLKADLERVQKQHHQDYDRWEKDRRSLDDMQREKHRYREECDKLRNLIRQYEIDMSTPEDKSQEAAYYNWLDDQNDKLRAEVERLKALCASMDVSKSGYDRLRAELLNAGVVLSEYLQLIQERTGERNKLRTALGEAKNALEGSVAYDMSCGVQAWPQKEPEYQRLRSMQKVVAKITALLGDE